MSAHPNPNPEQTPREDQLKIDAVTDRKSLAADKLIAERIPLGDPNDYKPCIARLPSGELLLTAFHQHQRDGNKVMEQTWLFRSPNGGRTWQSTRVESEQIKPTASNHTTRNVLELADGTLLLGVDYDGGGGPYFVWRSTDGGQTWDKSQKCEPKDFKSQYGDYGEMYMSLLRLPQHRLQRSSDSGRGEPRRMKRGFVPCPESTKLAGGDSLQGGGGSLPRFTENPLEKGSPLGDTG